MGDECVDPELLGLFLEELEEGIHQLNVTLLALQPALTDEARGPLWSACLRTAHSLKGAAQAARAYPVSDAFHLLEDLCARHRQRAVPLDHASVRTLLEVVDAVAAAAERLGRDEPSALQPLARFVDAQRASPRGAGPPSPRPGPPAEIHLTTGLEGSRSPIDDPEDLEAWESAMRRMEDALAAWRRSWRGLGGAAARSRLGAVREPLRAAAAHFEALFGAVRASGDALLEARAGEAPGELREPRRDAARRLLVVDDSATMRVAQRRLFERAGYQVEAAGDGVEAWRILSERAFDAVVSDVIMPELDGIGLTRRIRRSPAHESLPVVLVSSMDGAEHEGRALDAGAAAYVVKTAQGRAQMIETVAELLRGVP